MVPFPTTKLPFVAQFVHSQVDEIEVVKKGFLIQVISEDLRDRVMQAGERIHKHELKPSEIRGSMTNLVFVNVTNYVEINIRSCTMDTCSPLKESDLSFEIKTI